jgi:hypothetical protein
VLGLVGLLANSPSGGVAEAPVASVELSVVDCTITASADRKVDVKLKEWQLVDAKSSRKLFYSCLLSEPWYDSRDALHLLPGDEAKYINAKGELFTESSGWVEFTANCDQKVSVAALLRVLVSCLLCGRHAYVLNPRSRPKFESRIQDSGFKLVLYIDVVAVAVPFACAVLAGSLAGGFEHCTTACRKGRGLYSSRDWRNCQAVQHWRDH